MSGLGRIRYFLEDHLPYRLRWLGKLVVVDPGHWPAILARLDYRSMIGFGSSSGAVNRRIVDGLILRFYGPAFLETVLRAAEALDMKLFLTYGTLLGHCRESGFIAHDWDIDLGILERDIPKIPRLKDAVTAKGYFVARESRHRMAFRDRRNLVHLDIDYYFEKDGKTVHYIYNVAKRDLYTFSYPSDIFRAFASVRFLGTIDALVPIDAERFLTETYGDWRTPKTDQGPSDFPNVVITRVEPADADNYIPFVETGA